MDSQGAPRIGDYFAVVVVVTLVAGGILAIGAEYVVALPFVRGSVSPGGWCRDYFLMWLM